MVPWLVGKASLDAVLTVVVFILCFACLLLFHVVRPARPGDREGKVEPDGPDGFGWLLCILCNHGIFISYSLCY